MPFLAPATQHDLPIFYLFWVLLYLSVNVIWDIRSQRTPDFHVSLFAQKTPVAFNAASFASSLLLLIGLVSPPTMKLAGDTMLPIMMAGLSGVFFGIAEVCPYKPPKAIIPTGNIP